MSDEKLVECCDVTPLDYEQYELRFDHYIADERTGKRIRLEEPLVIKSVVAMTRLHSSAYVKNEIIERMISELYRKLKKSGDN